MSLMRSKVHEKKDPAQKHLDKRVYMKPENTRPSKKISLLLTNTFEYAECK